jgi:predicted kinase
MAAPIVVPDPSLVVLVGAAGSGKSTFAARHFSPDEVLSSDALRAVIGGDESNQGVTRAAFAALHRSVVRRLAARRLTVVDATNVRHHARAGLLRRARAAGVPVVAIVLSVPDAVAIARNRSRAGRTVDEVVVLRQLADLGRTAVPGRLEAEGFSSVIRLTSPEAVDAARIERVPLWHDPTP